jgi:hypothetical protein
MMMIFLTIAMLAYSDVTMFLVPMMTATTERAMQIMMMTATTKRATFKKYDKKMIELTQKARKQIQEETREWELQKSVTPVTDTTSRGKKDWSTHEARDLLIEDTKSGKAASMTPKELYEVRNSRCIQGILSR